MKKLLIILSLFFSSLSGMAPTPDQLGQQLLNVLMPGNIDIEKAKNLIKQGANIFIQGPMGSNILLWAVRTGDTELVTLLIEKIIEKDPTRAALKQEFTISEGMGGYQNPLREAASEGNEDMVKLLIHYGADINAEGPYGETPLSEAAGEGKKNIVELFLSLGADITGIRGATALREAIKENKRDIVELLLNKGVDVNGVDISGLSPLMWAASTSNFINIPEIIKLLIERGADITAKDKDGNTPFDIARKPEIKNLIKNTQAIKKIDSQNILNLVNILEILQEYLR